MGRRGPPPKPTSIRSEQWRRTRGIPEPTPTRPPCPAWLTLVAKREWRRVVPELERLGLLTVVDLAALAGYCQTYARWREAEEALSTKGLTYKAVGGDLRQRPEVGIAQKSLLLIKAFCAEFGFTPSSRSRMPVGTIAPERRYVSAAAASEQSDDPRLLLSVVQ